MHCYVVKSPVFRLQRGSAKSPLAPSSQDLHVLTLFKTEELFLINYPVLLTPDLGCIYYEYS